MSRDGRIVAGVALVVAAALVAGCAKEATSKSAGAAGAAAATSSQSLPPGHPDVSGTTQKPPLMGVVKETMNAGGYTYAKLSVGGTEVWAAGPVTRLAVGDTVAVAASTPMRNFTSPTLHRTFSTIYFTEGFLKPGQKVAEGMAGPGQGVVKQTIDVSTYTYFEVASGDSTIWLAGPTTKVEKGQTIAWSSGTPMENFRSPTLKRTFSRILFVGKVTVVAAHGGASGS